MAQNGPYTPQGAQVLSEKARRLLAAHDREVQNRKAA